MASSTSEYSNSTREQLLKFAFAAISNGTSAFVTNPVDVIKIRMQIDNEMSKSSTTNIFAKRKYKGLFHGMRVTVAEEGLIGLYKGVKPSIARDFFYGGFRIGSYEYFKVLYGATDPANTPLLNKIGAGATAGALGSAIMNPTDLIKVRMQAQKPNQPEIYRGITHAFSTIVKENGFRGLYVGCLPTVQRAAVVTASQVPSYDHVKHTFLNHDVLDEGVALHLICAMCAGFMAALASSPFDVVKTRMMNQKLDMKLYSSIPDCIQKTLKNEGPLAFYKGFIPNWLRIGPHTIITFFIFEQLRKLGDIRPI